MCMPAADLRTRAHACRTCLHMLIKGLRRNGLKAPGHGVRRPLGPASAPCVIEEAWGSAAQVILASSPGKGTLTAL